MILVGSWSRGDFSEQSDVDFLLVKRTKRNLLWRRADVRKMAGTDIPMDVAIHLVSLRNFIKMEAPF